MEYKKKGKEYRNSYMKNNILGVLSNAFSKKEHITVEF